jgi:hypothetical protein
MVTARCGDPDEPDCCRASSIALPATRYRIWAEARRTRRRQGRTLDSVNTAAVLADAMTDYVLTVGVARTAPAAGAPAHIAAWLEAHGYHVVHHSQVEHRPGGRDHAGRRPPGWCDGRATERTPEGEAR